MRLSFKIFVLFIILIMIGGLIVFNSLSSPDNVDWSNLEEGVFEIEKGEGVNAISRKLKDAGLIKSKLAFETFVWIKKLEGNFKAGEYKIDEVKSVQEIVSVLTGQDFLSKDQKITIIEGYNNKEIDEYFSEKEVLGEGEFIEQINILTKEKVTQYDFLASKPEGIDLEGYIFPDTYHITGNASAEEIIDKALKNFGSKLTPELREKIKEQGKTIHEIITLASIVENEVAKSEDMRIVAGIFWNRLEIGMALQSDATVNYITGGKTTQPTYDDLEADSLYNTYKHRGLPPGPIANPGIASIKAVVEPIETDYLFFLTTRENETIFSKTFAEHVTAKHKYLN